MTKISYDAQGREIQAPVRVKKVIYTSRARVRARNRRESIFRLGKIWQTKLVAARRRYYRGTEMLLTFFSPNEIKG